MSKLLCFLKEHERETGNQEKMDHSRKEISFHFEFYFITILGRFPPLTISNCCCAFPC